MILKTIVYDALYIIINYFISYIPCWAIRKTLLKILGMKIGKNSRINMKCVIMEPWNIIIGSGTMINEYCLIDGRGGLKIGNNCSVSMYSIIYTASHKSNSNSFDYFERETIIHDGVWIGARATILPGAIINNCCVIGANSVVPTGEYEKKSVYSGIPVVKIHDRNVGKIDDLYHCMFFR